jgi:23S rRNA pseudouridine1911/1915/1917 synthase
METFNAIIPNTTLTRVVTLEDDGKRIDQYLASEFPGYSRSFFQKSIDSGLVLINGLPAGKHSILVKTNDTIQIHFPAPAPLEKPRHAVDHLGVQVIYEHEHFLIINKPAGLVVHAPQREYQGITLVDWLISHFHDIATVGSADRPGIVHRLDKDTSGIMIIARTPYGLAKIGDMFKNRLIKKTYLALVQGQTPDKGSIDYPIDRHRTEPHRMTHQYGSGRPSLTHFETLAHYGHDASLIRAFPVTGRTHQIRVHCAAIGHPILGDLVYHPSPSISRPLISRQALHASTLSFSFEDQEYHFLAPLPADFELAIETLNRQHPQ